MIFVKFTKYTLYCMFALVFLLTACDSQEQAAKEKEAQAAHRVSLPLEGKTLEKAMPETTLGMSRMQMESATGAQTPQGMEASSVFANYRKAGTNQELTLRIFDYYKMTPEHLQMFRTGMQGEGIEAKAIDWQNKGQTGKSDTKYEGFEMYQKAKNFGVIYYFTDDRFLVSAEGLNLSLESLRKALAEIEFEPIRESVLKK